MSENVVEQQLNYPDDNYEGGLGVDEKEPELKWAVAGHSAVPELFNWLGRKTTEDIQKIREYLAQIESIRRLGPLSELISIAGKEADIIYVDGYKIAYSFSDMEDNEVAGEVNLVRTEPEVHLLWSMPEVSTSTNPTISIDIDIAGEGDNIGEEIISTTNDLPVPTQPDTIQRTVFDLGDVSEDTEDGYGFDTVRGKDIAIYVSRSPTGVDQGYWNLHSIEVK